MTDDCSENANCMNTEGSFECVCKSGYTGDGRTCEGIIIIKATKKRCALMYQEVTKRTKPSHVLLRAIQNIFA